MGILGRIFGSGTTTDCLELLEAQHEEVDALIEAIENGKGDRRAAFTELADKLAAHSTIEEKLFYPAVMQRSTNAMLREAVEEHLAIKRLLADMLQLRLGSDEFTAKLAVLKEQLTHHAHEEEERELFPEVRDLMSADERAGLGNEMLVMFDEVLAQHPSAGIAGETDTAAPLPSPRG